MTDLQIQDVMQTFRLWLFLGPFLALVVYDGVRTFLRAVCEWLS